MSEYIEVSETALAALEDAHDSFGGGEFNGEDVILTLVATHDAVESDTVRRSPTDMCSPIAERYEILD